MTYPGFVRPYLSLSLSLFLVKEEKVHSPRAGQMFPHAETRWVTSRFWKLNQTGQTTRVRVLLVISRLSYRARRDVARANKWRRGRSESGKSDASDSSVRPAFARSIHRDIDFLPMKSGVSESPDAPASSIGSLLVRPLVSFTRLTNVNSVTLEKLIERIPRAAITVAFVASRRYIYYDWSQL